MRILFVTWFFPPGNDVGALRTGAFARFFYDRGHQIHVLTAARVHSDESLPIPLPSEWIERTSFFDVDHPFRRQQAVTRAGPADRRSHDTDSTAGEQKRLSGLRAALSSFYVNLTHIPDRQIGWLPSAIPAGTRRLRRAPVDFIYASGPPFTTHLIASVLARRFSLPWVAEYRDPWCYYLYEPRQMWHQWANTKFEKAVVSAAAGVVALTDPWADYFREKFRRPTIAVYNGYDFSCPVISARLPCPDDAVSISYFGSLYGNVRDPSPLYEAIKRSGLTPSEIRITYYGPSRADIWSLAEKHQALPYIDTKSRVSLDASLRIQRDSDVLLLLQSPDDKRNVPAKLFEYLGSRRPILGIGLDDGVPAKLIRERMAGYYCSDPDWIAEQLKIWALEKKHTGLIADTPSYAIEGLSREEQFQKLENFLRDLAASKA